MKFPPLVVEMLETLHQSVREMRGKITDVRYGKIENDQNVILFTLDKINYKGVLRGRNADLVIGFGAEQDRAIALRVFVDGDATEI